MYAAPTHDHWTHPMHAVPVQAPPTWAPGYFLGENAVRRPSRKARRRVHRRERRLDR